MDYNDFRKIIRICRNKYSLERKTKIYNLYDELENLTQSVFQNDYGMLNSYHDLIFYFINDLILMYEKIIFRELEEFKWQEISLEDQEKIFKYVKDEIISKVDNEFDFLEKEVVEFCANYEYHDYWKKCILKKVKDEKTRKINYLNENININIQKIKIKFNLIEITGKQLKNYKNYDYRCKDKIFIPGTSSFYKSNEIIVNRNKINIGDSLFLLLLRLAVELKKGKGGWVNIHSLYDEHIITDPGKYQIYSNLRTVLQGSLIDKDAKEFIKNDGSKNYCLFTYPDFITYNKKKLLSHKDPQIKKLAEELPDNDK
jgi:hypothetical protein